MDDEFVETGVKQRYPFVHHLEEILRLRQSLLLREIPVLIAVLVDDGLAFASFKFQVTFRLHEHRSLNRFEECLQHCTEQSDVKWR